MRFESLEGKPEKERPKRTNLLAWVWTGTNGIRARHRAVCQRRHWAQRGVDTRWCARGDIGPQRGVDC